MLCGKHFIYCATQYKNHVKQIESSQMERILIAPAGFWSRGQNLRRHPWGPGVKVFTVKKYTIHIPETRCSKAGPK